MPSSVVLTAETGQIPKLIVRVRFPSPDPGIKSAAQVAYSPCPPGVRPVCSHKWGRRLIGRPPSLFVARRLGDQPHIGLSNETVIPLTLMLKCAVSWNLIDEPSEPVRCTMKVEW